MPQNNTPRGSPSRAGSPDAPRNRDAGVPGDAGGYSELVTQLARGVLESSLRQYLARHADTASIPGGGESVPRSFFGSGVAPAATASPDHGELATQLMLHAIEFLVRSYLRIRQRRRAARAAGAEGRDFEVGGGNGAGMGGSRASGQPRWPLYGRQSGVREVEIREALDALAAEMQATLAALDGLANRPCGHEHADGANCDVQSGLRAEAVRLRGGLDDLLSSVNNIRNLQIDEGSGPGQRSRTRPRGGSERARRGVPGREREDPERPRQVRERDREERGREQESNRSRNSGRPTYASRSVDSRPQERVIGHRPRSRNASTRGDRAEEDYRRREYVLRPR